MSNNYMFEARPHPVSSSNTSGNTTKSKLPAKAKYREPDSTPAVTILPKSNIHFDRRVVRGNTYSAVDTSQSQTIPLTSTTRLPTKSQSRSTTAGNTAARKRLLGQTIATNDIPVNGRTHMLVQTDDYLEELVDQIFEQDNGTQTEALEDLPVPPIFMPKAIGKDAGTCIEDGELFDYDLSIEPILEVLVGKTLEQSLLEVCEEEELLKLQQHRTAFEEERNQILVETQRLEAASQRHHAEKERRITQERERLLQQKILAQKNAARTQAKLFMESLQENVLRELEKSGCLYDPVRKEVETSFMPWLLEEMKEKLSLAALARAETESVLQSAIERIQTEVRVKREKEEAARKAEEERLIELEKQRVREEEEVRRKELEERAKKAEEEAQQAAEALRLEREENGDLVEDGDEEDAEERDGHEEKSDGDEEEEEDEEA